MDKQLAAMVTGASRGIGRGVATALDAAGYRVFATGRTIAQSDLPRGVVRLTCDHLDDQQTAAAFAQMQAAAGTLQVLVNCAWGGYERMVEGTQFTWRDPFWQQPAHRWTSMMDAGVRSAWVCSKHAAQIMVPQRRGLIVNLSFWAAQKHLGNALYGVSKAATDKLTADMAEELRPHGVTALCLYPGLVRTELVMAAAAQGWLKLDNSESPEFLGRVVAALDKDPQVGTRSGQILVAAAVAQALDVVDIDGKRPEPLTLQTV